MRVFLGITGASGAPYAARLVQTLAASDCEVGLCISRAGYEVLPVPVYYPDVTRILGKPVHRSVADVPGRMDVVNVFRKSEDLEPHLDDLIKARPRAVWLQTGIRDDAFAERLLAAGIDVVQDQCMMVEHRRWRSPG